MITKKNKTIEDDIIDFLECWGSQEMTDFLTDVIPLFELYHVDEQNDWVKELVGEENERNVRIIRTVYLLSRIAEFHSAKLCTIKMNFRNLYLKMEKHGIAEAQHQGE